MVSSKSRPKMSLQEILESEFCPPLDSSLVAALVSEVLLSAGGGTVSEETIKQLRETLSVLSIDATEDEQPPATDDANDPQLSSQSTSTEGTESIFDYVGDTSSASGSSMQSPAHSQASAFAFLTASFPNMPSSKISSILASYSTTAPDGSDVIDMERLVEDLLSEEHVRELEERGLDFEDDDSFDDAPESWQVVGKNMKKRLNGETPPPAPSIKGRRKGKGKGVTIALTDVRQQNRVAREPSKQTRGREVAQTKVDPWNQISSLATHLDSLLPGYSASFFQSFFHCPKYPGPSDALRAALRDITNRNAMSAEDGDDDDKTSLIPILEVLIPQWEQDGELDRSESEQIVADVALALSATGGVPDSVIDIVSLLRELDADVLSVQYSRGIYHYTDQNSSSVPVTPLVLNLNRSRSPNRYSSPSGPRSNSSKRAPLSPTTPSSPLALHSTINSTWQGTKVKPARGPTLPTHAEFIPAYNPSNVAKRKKDRSKPNAPVQKQQPESYASQMRECRVKRDEALREASRYWQRGNMKTRGGEVAMFYAERARAWQEKSKVIALDDARARVDAKRTTSTNRDTIDLHYTTTSEAITIVKEVLSEGWVTANRPLSIITGRGSHSANGVAVLGPAVKNALEAEGWNVAKWTAGLIVRGKTRMSG